MNLWKDKKSEFEPDGSLRDIYIFNANKELWNCFIKNVSRLEHRNEFWHGDSKQNLPASFEEIKILQETEPTTLKILLKGNIQVNCHFFIEEEIEMDISPREIDSEFRHITLMSFLNWLSSLVAHTVYLTYENTPNQVILSVESKNV